MSILIDRAIGYDATVFEDLLEIVRCDPGLATFEYSPFTYQVTYTQKKAAVASSTRLLAIVQASMPVLLVGVGSTFVLSNGLPITARAAVTEFMVPTYLITIWYDVTDAGGRYYVVHDPAGTDIYAPRQVNLYHELAHAYHIIQKDLPDKEFDAEVQGVADENAFRAQLGLLARHPTDHYGAPGEPSHGGVGFPTCKPKDTGWSPGWKCSAAVATAALGSAEAEEIVALRRARQKYRAMSLWTALIAEPTLQLYGKFSVGIVRDMLRDPLLRQAMLHYAVQPTVHLLRIAEAYLAAESDSAALAADLDRALGDYVAGLARAGGSAPALRDAADGAAQASRLLVAGTAAPPAGRLPGALFPYLAGAVGKGGGPTTAFAWAFDGLALLLRQAADRFDGGGCIDGAFLRALGAWVGRFPVPPQAQLTLADAPGELAVLGARVFTRPDVRMRFARHLLARWPAATAPALRQLLVDLRYLLPDHDTTARGE